MPAGRLLRRWRAGANARRRWVAAGRFGPGGPIETLSAYRRYVTAWRAYSRLPGAEPLAFRDSLPCLFDDQPVTPYDAHYFHQAAWAMRQLVQTRPARHVDVGSDIAFVGVASALVPVTFVDIRPLSARVEGLRCIRGDLLQLPFEDASVESLSSLHVVEHVGLGRYGDRLAADGTARACAELVRILEPGGRLLLSLPIGRARVCFNAHRVHDAEQVLELLAPLSLAELAVVDDSGDLVLNAELADTRELTYGCGLFAFVAEPS